MDKKRVLLVNEASYLATGFSTYGNEILSRLYKSGEFELAEFGSYARDDDPRNKNIPWKFYPNQPSNNDQEGLKQYHSDRTAQFGSLRFPQVCLDFKPDIVIDIRDYWMCEFIDRSPSRQYFKMILMPTIDGIPQKEDWLDLYGRSDKILTYSDWGFNVLKSSGRENTPLVCPAYAGVDIDTFKPPADKREHKQKFGFAPDSIIIGMVARNQKRKLFYDLIEAFAQWIYKNKSKGHLALVNKTFLYLHTSYPDQGWDLGKAIQEFNVGNKVLMTYLCKNCNTAFPSFFAGELCYCKKCNKLAAQPPNANTHVPRHILSGIMQLFDLHVQYSISEGFGMPSVEAMACGVPVAATRYSAMEDYFNAPYSIPIEVDRYFREPMTETEQRRAYPSNKDFVQKLDNFMKLNEDRRKEISKKIRDYIVEPIQTYGTDQKFPRYSWDRTAEIWRNVIRDTEIHDRSKTWDNNHPLLKDPNKKPPNNLNNADFVRWLIGDFWQRPKLCYTMFAGQWIKGLNCGFIQEGPRQIQINKQIAYDNFKNMIENENKFEIMKTTKRKIYDENKLNLVSL